MASTSTIESKTLTLEKLRKASSLHDVAHLLGFTPKALAYVIYKVAPEHRYSSFEIPKKSGGSRVIHAPISQLKLLQRRLADRLQDCVDAIALSTGIKDSASHGFVPGKSIYTNASAHRRKRYVFNVDLQDFFGSINFGRVRGFFISNKNFKLNDHVATVIAQIACHDPNSEGLHVGHQSKLPQGSPCSPIISNLLGNLLDLRLLGLAKQHGCHYTRYADDLTFSTNKDPFPIAIAQKDGATNNWEPGKALVALINDSGFQLNNAKTRMQYRTSRQEVTGLVVNSIINTRADYRRRVRAMVRSLTQTGKYQTKDGVDQNEMAPLAGMLGFVSHIDRERRKNGTSLSKDRKTALSSRERIYQRFLFYRHFYSSEVPIILCEGKTDVIYLKFAFNAMRKEFPEFYSEAPDKKIEKHVRLFDHSDKNTASLMGLSGGAGDLSNFLRAYFREVPYFKAPNLKAPILVLADNDSGFKGVFNTVKDLCKGSKPSIEDVYFDLGLNVYVVPTPLVGKEESMIEDFFDAATLDKKLDGKSFHKDGKGFDKTKHYSKQVFATQVVMKNHDTLNFHGFKPLLETLRKVLTVHKGKRT